MALVVLLGACSTTADTGNGGEGPGSTVDPGVASVVAPPPVGSVPASEPLPELTTESGELVWVHEQEPPDLHVDDPDNGTVIAAWIRQGLLEGLFGIDQHQAYYPELLARAPTPTVQDNGRVVIDYELRSGLVWSDGEPLTADDVAFTHQILVEGCQIESDGSIVDGTASGCEYDMGDRIGYDLVTGFSVTSPTAFTVTLASFFPDWRSLYPQIFAEHAFGADAIEVDDSLRQWQGPRGVLPSSGPLVFAGWQPGVSLVLTANERYHGSASPDASHQGPLQVDGVRVVFRADRGEQVDLIEAGLAHMVATQAHDELLPLLDLEGFTVAPTPGPVYEHWGLNLLNPHLAKPEVREAIVMALDKAELVAEVFNPVFGGVLPADGLGNAYWMPDQPGYQDHQAEYAGNQVAEAAAVLTEAGYARGGDGVWNHPDDGRLSLRIGTTGGNVLRDQALDVARDQLARAGIELSIDSAPGGLFLSDGPFAEASLQASATKGRLGDPGLWDIAQFSWTAGPWPGLVSGAFRSGSAANPYGFGNPEFDVAATDCDGLAADTERRACYNTLDTFVTTLAEGPDGLFVIPLTQRPVFFGYDSAALASAAVVPGGVGGGPLVNVVDFAFR